MGTALYRRHKIYALTVALFFWALPNKAFALAVECAGCVAAINQTTSAVETGNAKLETIQSTLTTIQNHLNQIRLAVGPASTVASSGNLAQGLDFLNFSALQPSVDVLKLDKGTKIDFGNLGGLRSKLNNALAIYNDAKSLKDIARNGNPLQTAEAIRRVTQRRDGLYRNALEQMVSGSVYSLSQGQAAKNKELSLDQGLRGSLNLQTKVKALGDTQAEILSRLNHLIALMASRNMLDGSNQLNGLPRDTSGETPPPAKNAPGAGNASSLFKGGTQ